MWLRHTHLWSRRRGHTAKHVARTHMAIQSWGCKPALPTCRCVSGCGAGMGYRHTQSLTSRQVGKCHSPAGEELPAARCHQLALALVMPAAQHASRLVVEGANGRREHSRVLPRLLLLLHGSRPRRLRGLCRCGGCRGGGGGGSSVVRASASASAAAGRGDAAAAAAAAGAAGGRHAARVCAHPALLCHDVLGHHNVLH